VLITSAKSKNWKKKKKNTPPSMEEQEAYSIGIYKKGLVGWLVFFFPFNLLFAKMQKNCLPKKHCA
jgi:hypothetical protein